MVRKAREPTVTSLVFDLLVRADDFLKRNEIAEATGANPNQVSAALTHLYRCKAIDAVACQDRLWWFATPESDTRTMTVDERVKEEHRKRKSGYKTGPRRAQGELPTRK